MYNEATKNIPQKEFSSEIYMQINYSLLIEDKSTGNETVDRIKNQNALE